ncbi:MAG: hypothetical protein L6Q95_05500 [Planctomycetes bacterium]|nr:hypothetical protein [Planctomycetota bacterium]
MIRRSFVCAVLLGVLVTAASARKNKNPGVLPPQSSPHGKTYGEWGAAWWEWAASIPADSNPLLDQTGESCHEGQSGKVFFLAGTFGETGVVRECTIPTGTALFFPIVNVVAWAPEDGSDEDAVRALANALADEFDILEVEVDGTAIEDPGSYRAESPAFTLPAPEDGVLGLDAPREPAVADGFWIMLAPLSRGEHVVRIHGGSTTFGFEVEVTYLLAVE